MSTAPFRKPETATNEIICRNTARMGSAIRTLRERKDLSLEKCAEKTGINASLLSRIERGVSVPSHNAMQAIANILDLPVACVAFLYSAERPGEEQEALRKFMAENIDVLEF